MAFAADPDAPAWPADAVEVGRVIGAWGIKGWVRVQPFSQDPQALFSSKRWFVRAPHGPAATAQAWPQVLRVREARDHGDGVVAWLQEVDDRDGAESLKGARLFVSRQSFPTPDPNEFYWVDLIGLQVVNRDGQALGVVQGLLDSGAQTVLQLRAEDAPGGERLIPFVGAIIDDVNLAERRITADWGLDY